MGKTFDYYYLLIGSNNAAARLKTINNNFIMLLIYTPLNQMKMCEKEKMVNYVAKRRLNWTTKKCSLVHL